MCPLCNDLFTLFCSFFCECRVVADDQRAIALGFQSTIWRFCGALPGPPLFGFIFDLACELWQEECDGRRGNCWIYNHSLLTYYVAAFAYPCQICGTILFICAFLTFPKRKKGDDAEKS